MKAKNLGWEIYAGWAIISAFALLAIGIIGVVIFAPEALGNWLFDIPEVKITDLSSPTLTETLKEQYGIVIPEDAKLIDGCIFEHPQDPDLVILFECDIDATQITDDNISELFQLEPTGRSGDYDGTRDPEFRKAYGGEMDRTMKLKNYSSISYKVEDRKLLVRFCGLWPHMPR